MTEERKQLCPESLAGLTDRILALESSGVWAGIASMCGTLIYVCECSPGGSQVRKNVFMKVRLDVYKELWVSCYPEQVLTLVGSAWFTLAALTNTSGNNLPTTQYCHHHLCIKNHELNKR